MSGYLPLGFEYGIELTYPEPEGTSSGMLNFLAQVFKCCIFPPSREAKEMNGRKKSFFFSQIFGIIFTLCDGKVIDKWGTLAGNILLSSFLLLGMIVTGKI